MLSSYSMLLKACKIYLWFPDIFIVADGHRTRQANRTAGLAHHREGTDKQTGKGPANLEG